jgi:hypothetical protein
MLSAFIFLTDCVGSDRVCSESIWRGKSLEARERGKQEIQKIKSFHMNNKLLSELEAMVDLQIIFCAGL